MYRLRLLLLLLSLATPAFAANAQWVQVHSPNFTVVTDAGEKRGREVAMHFEQMRAVFGTLFAKAKINSSQPLYVLAFKNTRDFRNVCPLWQGKPVELAGYFQPGNGVTYIALDLSTENKWNVVFHEYGHFLLNSNTSANPPWFDEGFAEFFSTVKVEGKNFLFGNIPESAPYILQQNKWLPIEQLFSTTHDSPYYNERNRSSVFYAESWLAMAHLWFDPERRPHLSEYMKLRDQKVPVDDAIQRAFGTDGKALDKDLHEFYSSGRLKVFRANMPPGIETLAITTTPLETVDAGARIAELKLQMRDRRQESVGDFEAILREKPDHPVALRGLAFAYLQSGDKEKAASLFRRAAATQSDDPHVYYFSAVLLSQLDAEHKPELLTEMQSNLQHAIRLDPSFADAYGWLGLSYAWQGDTKAAIQPTEKAIELSPRNEQWAMNLAGFYATNERFDDALAICKRLMQSSDTAIAQNASQMFSGLGRYKHEVEENAKFQQERGVPVTTQDDASSGEDDAPPPMPVLRARKSGSGSSYVGKDQVLTYFVGTLQQANCAGSKGTFVVATRDKSLTLTTSDLQQVSFSGKRSFTCSLHDVKVKGFYRKETDTDQLVALEIE